MFNPNMVPVRQQFNAQHIDNISEAAAKALAAKGDWVHPGEKIAIAVGSRGVANIAKVTRAVCDFVRAKGAQPFIFPAMGSHGNATPEGQREVLAGYGVTEEAMGAPIVSSLKVERIPSELPMPVYMDAHALAADGTVVINRIKPHTDFHGDYESGLMKMCVIGTGKHAQALAVHRYGADGLRDYIPQIAREVLQKANVRLGIGLVENAYDQTMLLEALTPEEIPTREPELLEIAKANMPRLPVDALDILLIDQMGKDISGVGIDTNIIGRMGIPGQPEPAAPRIKRITVSRLTPGAHGNAIGMGLADFCTQELMDGIDWAATYENTVTSTFLSRGNLPLVAKDEAQAFAWALRTIGTTQAQDARIIRIRDTLHLSEFWVSEALWHALAGGNIEQTGPAQPLLDEATGRYRG
ncbi:MULTISPECIES: DUF2088 domain-containing protein [unclassified Clostridium]|uniref:DUF2088 domain-containing protein n=1 Tax=unclassified Clostridium TaxID=2614128 RepID=UPI001105F8C6|nr:MULTISPECIES: DUF2088 domain-containing protein [unclassified Clostridium]